MHHLPRPADLAIILTTLVGQCVLGRLYFTRWKSEMSRVQFRISAFVLLFLWFCSLMDLISMSRRLRFLPWAPIWIRGIAFAIGTTWALTSAGSLVLYFLVRWLMRRRRTEEFSPRRRAMLQAAVALPFTAVAFGGIVERTNFQVKEIDLPVPNLHPDLEGFRIVQISDLHVSPFLSIREAARVIDMANELKAHLAVMTGDLISEPGDPLDETIRELARLRSDTGVLGCLGNHENYVQCQDYATVESAKFGIQFLRHQAHQVHWGNGILNVAGIDYESSRNHEYYLRGAERLVMPETTNLLLSHNPDVFPAAVRKGFDAMLAGHTHGGQVTVEILNQTANFARFVTPFVSGLYRIDGRSCYVTPGI
jgi:predicted MPP superfamily phosphohydrolase